MFFSVVMFYLLVLSLWERGLGHIFKAFFFVFFGKEGV